MNIVDPPDYISCFTNLRRLTFANIYSILPGRHRRNDIGESFGWVNGVVAIIQSPITHLTFEILVHRLHDITLDWKALDVLISSREALRSLVQVSVVFLDRLGDGDGDLMSTVHPVALRRLMPLTAMMGLLTISAGGRRLYP